MVFFCFFKQLCLRQKNFGYNELHQQEIMCSGMFHLLDYCKSICSCSSVTLAVFVLLSHFKPSVYSRVCPLPVPSSWTPFPQILTRIITLSLPPGFCPNGTITKSGSFTCKPGFAAEKRYIHEAAKPGDKEQISNLRP